MYDVIALGEILVDFISKERNKAGYPVLEGNPGGGPPNFAAACAKLGLRTAFIGKVGNDMFGDLLIDTLNKSNIDTRFVVRDDGHFTTLAFVSLAPDGERSFSFSRKLSADIMLTEEELPKDALETCKAFHFSSLSLIHEPSASATKAAVGIVKKAGAVVSFDPNYRDKLWDDADYARKQISYGVGVCDVLKLSEEELLLLYDAPLDEAAARLLRENPNIKIMYVTLGSEGARIYSGKRSFHIPAFRLDCADTTGAGDIFGGSAMYQLLQYDKKPEDLTEEELRRIGVFATAAAAISTLTFGGIPSAPDLQTVEAFLKTTENGNVIERD
ncbi:MAG TPA: carbohydrate kinase [Anaerovoracaceae bacterium]|nr:carbohydrate kinase [Anaerovoracaceae bacterium]